MAITKRLVKGSKLTYAELDNNFTELEQADAATLTSANGYTDAAVAGLGDKNYIHDQSTPSATWTIAHNLNKYPSVTVIDTANSLVEGVVDFTDTNNLVITFNGSFSGTATLN